MCLSESLERAPLCNCTSRRMKIENLSLFQNTAMGGKGEAWKVLSLTHVEYKVGWRLTRLSILTRSVDQREFVLLKVDTERISNILNSLLCLRRTTRWGRCLQFIPSCLLSLSSFLLQLSLSGVTPNIKSIIIIDSLNQERSAHPYICHWRHR